jgi:signal transduction histidine kinase
LLELDLPEPQKRTQIQRLKRAAEGANRLIDDLLDVSRIDAGRFSVDRQPEHVQLLVLEARELLSPLAEEKGVVSEFEAKRDLPIVAVDRERLLQVFSNLIGNAVKFTPAGGNVQVKVDGANGEVVIRIRDTGPGITETDLPHIFDRFWQAKRTGRAGAGLGLAIAKGIIEAHDGRIWAESEPGNGAAFYFTLPAGAAMRLAAS